MSKQERKSAAENVLKLPWQVHLVIAAMAMLVSAFLPDVIRHPKLVPLVKLVAQLAWFAAFAFGLLGIAAYAIKRYREENPFRLDLAKADEATTAGKAKRPDHWSLELLQELEWKRFEELCGLYYAKQGFRVETIRCGADGTLAAQLLFKGPEPSAILQCRTWSGRLGVEPVRELLGVMAGNKVSRGILHASGGCTEEAVAAAHENHIELVGGSDFLRTIGEMDDDVQKELLQAATEGDYTTPTCPSCKIKMVMRNSDRGYVWQCRNQPRCGQTFQLRADE